MCSLDKQSYSLCYLFMNVQRVHGVLYGAAHRECGCHTPVTASIIQRHSTKDLHYTISSQSCISLTLTLNTTDHRQALLRAGLLRRRGVVLPPGEGRSVHRGQGQVLCLADHSRPRIRAWSGHNIQVRERDIDNDRWRERIRIDLISP